MNRTEVTQRLRACVDDPMWPNHAEVSKATLLAALGYIGEQPNQCDNPRCPGCADCCTPPEARNVEELARQLRERGDPLSMAASGALLGLQGVRDELLRRLPVEPPTIPDDPACTCGSDSKRAYHHAGNCPHSTPWNERVKDRLVAASAGTSGVNSSTKEQR